MRSAPWMMTAILVDLVDAQIGVLNLRIAYHILEAVAYRLTNYWLSGCCVVNVMVTRLILKAILQWNDHIV